MTTAGSGCAVWTVAAATAGCTISDKTGSAGGASAGGAAAGCAISNETCEGADTLGSSRSVGGM